MQRVEIRVKSCLDENWNEWLEGFTLNHTGQGETVLTGVIKDQTALYGLMSKLRDLGLILLAVNVGTIEHDSHEENC
jgi:hypothetical protein